MRTQHVEDKCAQFGDLPQGDEPAVKGSRYGRRRPTRPTWRVGPKPAQRNQTRRWRGPAARATQRTSDSFPGDCECRGTIICPKTYRRRRGRKQGAGGAEAGRRARRAEAGRGAGRTEGATALRRRAASLDERFQSIRARDVTFEHVPVDQDRRRALD